MSRTNTPAPDDDVDYYVAGYIEGRWSAPIVGHVAAQVETWLAAHPEFKGEVYADWRDDSDHVNVTEIFLPGPLLDEIEAANDGAVNLLDAMREREAV